MSYKRKEKSETIDTVQTRLAAMLTIDANQKQVVNYGDDKKPCTSAIVQQQVDAVMDKITQYNGLLDQADGLKNDIEQGESDLRELSARVLAGATAKFGRDSSEVEQLGGTRQSERAKAQRAAAVKKTS